MTGIRTLATVALAAVALTWSACGQGKTETQHTTKGKTMTDHTASGARAQIVLGGGCFWCLEAVYERVEGVTSVESGYAGGTTPHPTYQQVCAGSTGHAEVARITYDPAVISLEEILDIFWQAHDATTMNRQGNDVGTQYRSIILPSDDAQRKVAEESRRKAQEKLHDSIVTEISPLKVFYPAEDYHQDYYRLNPNQPYCRVVISPKLKKLGLE
jgi:peptide-methionine (S)-S-oxide reductase